MGRRIDTPSPKVCASGLTLVLLALVAPRVARADDADRAPVIAIDLAADAAITAHVFGAARTAPAGLIAYALGGPIVHAANGKWAQAGESLGVRLVVPLIGAAIGCEATGGTSRSRDDDDDSGCWLGLPIGLAAGMVIAQVFDAAYLSRASDQPPTRMLTLGASF